MAVENRTLIVGTTSDYIELIENRYPGQTLFLTDQAERSRVKDQFQIPQLELCIDLSNYNDVENQLDAFQKKANIKLDGIVCYDDESLLLASHLAIKNKLPFPGQKAIELCRDKAASKALWKKAGLSCPDYWIASTPAKDAENLKGVQFPCVVKPVCGSGSELVFLCQTKQDLKKAISTIRSSEILSQNPRMYGERLDNIIIEEYIMGEEFSCDFAIVANTVQILRTARKVFSEELPVGTSFGYVLPGHLSERIQLSTLTKQLKTAAKAVGLERAICMADFIVDDEGGIYLLEITPRMGGDCLPHILHAAWGIDSIGANLYFSRGQNIEPWLKDTAPSVVGLRLHARETGTFHSIDFKEFEADSRFIERHQIARKGRQIALPPEDYSSWLLGYVIFQPFARQSISTEIQEILVKNKIKIENKS